MKTFIMLIFLSISLAANSAVPTEEGLLKNLNNSNVSGNLITVKASIQNLSPTVGSVSEAESVKPEFYKWVLSLENPNAISLLQVSYTNSQMMSGQIHDVKYIPDLLTAIKKEKSPEKGMFYAVLMMLTTNQPQGLESFLEKGGASIVRNKNILNEEKIKLLRTYRTYLANNKGKGEANSPLNPPDPQSKAKVLELFKANTYQRSSNVELIKTENEFLWKADWKSVKGYFSNEERRLRIMELASGDNTMKLEASEYVLFNGINELPKFILFKDLKGQSSKMQILSLETKTNREKKLIERFEETKKNIQVQKNGETSYSFLF
jgi:hypothetical protein